MFDLDPVIGPVLVDSVKPSGDPGEEFDRFTAFAKERFVEFDAFPARHRDHGIEIREDLFASRLVGELGGLAPKLGCGHPHSRDEAEVLHVSDRQSGVEIVENGANGLFVQVRCLRMHLL